MRQCVSILRASTRAPVERAIGIDALGASRASLKRTPTALGASGAPQVHLKHAPTVFGAHVLWTRKEKEIAVISHSGFLNNTVDQFGNDCHLSVKSEICSHFANCELRSFVLVDRGMIGSDSSSTNYPGKIPYGTDIPCDFAKEKIQGNELKTVRAFNGLI